MRVLVSVVTSLLLLAGANATALTSLLLAGEKACYYADVDGVGEKIGASWAVRSIHLLNPPRRIPNLVIRSRS